MRKIVKFAFVFVLGIVMAACSKQSEDKKTSLEDIKSTENVKKAAVQNKIDQAPSADMSIPFDSYQKLTSGKQIMFRFLAVDNMPINYDEIAETLDNKIRVEGDQFKKNDMLKAMRPAIDAEIAKAKNSGYFYAVYDLNSLKPYNFEQKSFENGDLSSEMSYYFWDESQYKYKFSNADKFHVIKVSDEQLAREIESLRNKRQLEMRVFFFINATEIGTKNAVAQLTKFQLLTKAGKVLVEF